MVLSAFHTIGDTEDNTEGLKLLHDVLYRAQSVDQNEAVLRIDPQYGEGDNFSLSLDDLGKQSRSRTP